ncbi:MAG: hypothetical protein ITG02_02195 [Patulibacter sp.]|nr:hypothetical protein [Patulibacter sp.]
MRATTTSRFGRWRWLLAALATVGVAAPASAGAAEFGFLPGSTAVELLDGDGDPQSQAGSHPDLRVAFQVAPSDPDVNGNFVPSESLKDVEVKIPPGIIGNLNATPICHGTARDTTTCPLDTAVGEANLLLAQTPMPSPGGLPLPPMLVHRLPAPKGVAARLGFWIINISVVIDVRVTPDGGYRLVSNVDGVSTASMIWGQSMTLWGVPADHNGPATAGAPGARFTAMGRWYNGPVVGPRLPFMWAPTRCGVPLDASIAISSWQQPERTVTESTRVSDGLTGCEQLPFAPKLSVKPDSSVAGQPSGYAIDLELPQQEGPDDLATSQLQDATVALPEGVAISPGRARGLDVCTDEQLGEGQAGAESCPSASRIGELRIDSPLLPDPLTGTVYMGQQRSQDPASGEMYRMFMVAHDPESGVRIKLRGQVKADPRTGQLTTTFADNPELPFSKLSLRLDGGERAALVNPTTCGEQTASLAANAWAGASTTDTSTFVIDQGCGVGVGFSPRLSAGTLNPLARQFSPFAMTVERGDRDQDLSRIGLELPSGLLGALGSVPLCGDAQAAAGACHASTRVGSVTVTAGTGAAPYALDGQVFVGGPYRGAPFSLAFVVPAKAGPFDLGTVVVRAPLRVDANAGRAAVMSDPLPTIVGGVPLHLQRVQVALDRPRFMFNATSCQPMRVTGALISNVGAAAHPSVHYQAQGCDRVPLRPKLKMEITGGSKELGKKGAPGIEAELTQEFGESGLRQVKVTLPPSLALNTNNSNEEGALCEPAQAAARACPESSRIGWAEAETPALHEPLKGPVYFVRGERTVNGRTVATLPGLYVKLDGQGVPLDLRATSSVTSKSPQLLEATFSDIPDAPIKRFRLSLKSGKGSVLQTANGVCPQRKTTRVSYEGHTGGEHVAQFKATAPGCDFGIDSVTDTRGRVSVRVTGIGAGEVRLSGRRLVNAKRTIRASDTARITARLTRSSIRSLDRGSSVKLKLRVQYDPKDSDGKTERVTKTVTLEGTR